MMRLMIEDPSWIYFGNRIFRMEHPITAARAVAPNGGYEFSSGAGSDLEDTGEWREAGILPCLTSFAQDLFPNHSIADAMPAIVDPLTTFTAAITEGQERLISVLHGFAIVKVQRLDGTFVEHELDREETISVDGPCVLTIESYTDTFLILAGVAPDEDGYQDDMLNRAMQAGYSETEGLSDGEDGEEETGEAGEPSGSSRCVATRCGFIPDLSSITSLIPEDPEEKYNLWIKETAGKIVLSDWILRRKVRALVDLLANSLDSPYLSRGFIPPSPVWKRIIQERPAESTEAADDRKELFFSLHTQAKKISNLVDLYGANNDGGFYGKIRSMNQEDRDLALAWSERPLKTRDPSGQVITTPSAFHTARETMRKDLVARGLSQSEVTRQLWHHFDRIGGRSEPVYQYEISCTDCSNKDVVQCSVKQRKKAICPSCSSTNIKTLASHLVSSSQATDDSVWRQKRTEAFQGLHLTKAAWNTIYCQLEIQKERIQKAVHKGTRVLNEDGDLIPIPDSLQARQQAWADRRNKVLEDLRGFFEDCTSRTDLLNFKQVLFHQQISRLDDKDKGIHAGDILFLSPADQIGFGDEIRIYRAYDLRLKQIAKTTEKTQEDE